MDLFSLFESIAAEEEKKAEEQKKKTEEKKKKETEKKEAEQKKKAEEKKDSKAKQEKKSKYPTCGFDVEGDVTVVGRNINIKMEKGVVKNSQELVAKLIQDGYDMFKISGIKLWYVPDLNKVLVDDSQIIADEKNIEVELPVTVVDGMVKCQIDPKNPTMDLREEGEEGEEEKPETITVAEVIKKWVEVNPSYEGCGIYYDKANNLAYPVGKLFSREVEVGSKILREGEIYTTEESGNAKDIAEKLGGTKLYAMEKVYYLIYQGTGKSFTISSSAKGVTKTKAEDKYKLPLNVYMGVQNVTMYLSPELFGGKEEVKYSEIIELLKNTEGFRRTLNNTDYKFSHTYDEDINQLSIHKSSGTLGYRLPDMDDDEEEEYAGVCEIGDKIIPGKCFLVNGSSEMDKVLTFNNFYGHFTGDYKGDYYNGEVYKTPLGCFMPQYKDSSRVFDKLRFIKTSPKIPVKFLYDCINYFKGDLTRERACRIYMNKKTGDFKMVKSSEDSSSKVFINYNYKDMEVLNDEWMMMLDVHSHNTMAAVFSPVDDQEQTYPGNFMVLGRLDSKISYSLRAGYEGIFCKLPFEEVFC